MCMHSRKEKGSLSLLSSLLGSLCPLLGHWLWLWLTTHNDSNSQLTHLAAGRLEQRTVVVVLM